MRRAKFDPNSDGQQQQPSGPDHTVLCRVAGCGRRWAVDISHGRVCSFHDEQFSQAEGSKAPKSFIERARGLAPLQLPRIPPSRPFSEPDESPEF